MKTLCYSIHDYDRPFIEESNNGKHDMRFTKSALSIETADQASGFEAVSIFSGDDASREVLIELSRHGVKYIALRSVGYNHVDLDTALALGMKVANVPEYSPYAIAEHAVAMLLTLNRKLLESQRLIDNQDFRLDHLIGFDLHGKTVGIVGTGKIGIAFSRIMKGFGCRIIGYDICESVEAKDIGLEYVTMNKLLSESDIISLHCPLSEATRYLIGEDQFKRIKKGAYLINTARGSVINTHSMIKYIKDGTLGGVCLDVYEYEKGLFFNDWRNMKIEDDLFLELRSFKNVLITGHQAFLTTEALRGIADTTLMNLTSWSQDSYSMNDLSSDL